MPKYFLPQQTNSGQYYPITGQVAANSAPRFPTTVQAADGRQYRLVPIEEVSAPEPAQTYYPITPPRPEIPVKETKLAYLLLIFGGIFGFHQFYLGNPLKGLVYMCTLGGLLLGVLTDALTLPAQVRQINVQRKLGMA